MCLLDVEHQSWYAPAVCSFLGLTPQKGEVLVKKVFFVAAMLLSASSSLAGLDSQKVTIQPGLTPSHTQDSNDSRIVDLASPSSLLGTDGDAVRGLDDLGKAETYSCPIQLGKPYAISSASSDVSAEKNCPGFVR